MYALIGYPLGHSFSADFFNAKFSAEGIDNSYRLMPIADISKLPALLVSHPDLQGFNVTIPYKESVIPYLDAVSDEAAHIGAVNVVKILNGRRIGYNSDAPAFRESLLGIIGNRRPEALVLGTGGASKAVAYALESLGIKFSFVSRKKNPSILSYDELTEEIIRSHKLIINCTPVGMAPNTEASPSIPYQFLTDSHILFDLIYNPAATQFLINGLKAGATVKNGLEMLHLQALKAWEIWNS